MKPSSPDQSTDLLHCRTLDAQDPLSSLRDHFSLPDGIVYLDGNSLGALPKAAPARLAEVVNMQWGQGLIRSWNTADWFTLPQRLGDKIAKLIGADNDEVVATDSTSINLYKVLAAALSIAAEDRPQRKVVLSERSNFPTDLYIAQSLCQERGFELRLTEPENLLTALNDQVAVLMLTHVNYRTGTMHDMDAVTIAAHQAGALVLWDLAHSAGAVPLSLKASDADFAIGCGYKYLNGGPGAPAFVWVHPKNTERFWQPLAGWWGHSTPFEFTPDYRPAPGITRYLCGTQSILSMAALECGLDVFEAAAPLGGMNALRAKSLALTDLFIALVAQTCDGHGLNLVTPRNHHERGSQVCLSRKTGANAIIQALINRGVIGDFRAGDGGFHQDILRFGFTPLYTRFEDVWLAADHLRQVLETGEWTKPCNTQKQNVT
jgi:kynureninase